MNTSVIEDGSKSKMLKALTCGENPFSIVMCAAEYIGMLTGDKSFGEVCRKAIGAVYAYGLREPQAAEIKRQELSEKRERIKSALWNTSDSDTRERLINSIRHIDTEIKKLDIIIQRL